jgi:Fur family peroxide stress response transcriptional regulator
MIIRCAIPELRALLRNAGQKATRQRLAVLSALKQAHGHLTAGQILTSARPTYAALDQSTVYRTLLSAEQAGLVVRFTNGTGDAEFEWVREQHHHLICDVCGRISTLDESALDELASSTPPASP